jgi:hypothetical protein
MHKSQCRNKKYEKQDKMSLPNLNNFTVTKTNDSDMDETSDKKFKK